jgi:high-affinity nickel permease
MNHRSSSEDPAVLSRALQVALIASVIVVSPLLAAQPAAAAESDNPVCQEESGTLTDMIEGFVQLTTGLGVMGLLVVWQADELMEMFTLSREQKASLKEHKRGAMKSGVVLTVLGPLFTLAGNSMNLPIAECVDLIPF